ncbi:hypothetical protein [Streptomyces sp. NPDC056160]|uniref:hypothetical protein n=1 Tax=Streptomyces sp. NPDC056160 TaxID=3345731 RepID=UPI0035DA307C
MKLQQPSSAVHPGRDVQGAHAAVVLDQAALQRGHALGDVQRALAGAIASSAAGLAADGVTVGS